MAQGYYGTTSYNSFNQKYYIQYLKALGVIEGKSEAETRWASGLTNRMILEGLNCVKYVLTNMPINGGMLAAYDSLAKFGNVTVLKHKYALPIGYAYTSIFSLTDFKKCSPSQKDFMSLRAAIVSDSNMNEVGSLKKLNINDTLAPQSFTFQTVENYTDTLAQQAFQIKRFKPTHIEGNIKVNTNAMVYFSIPFDENWTIKDAKNKIYKKILLSDGMIGIYLEKGNHELTFSFASKNLALGKKVSIIGVFLFALLIFMSLKFKKNEE
jgi:uncharacterized membrane protein YfhO